MGFMRSQKVSIVKLISVSGVGASTARTMLSSLSPNEIFLQFLMEMLNLYNL